MVIIAVRMEPINKKIIRNTKTAAINPLTSPREGVTVFTSPYLSAGAPAFGEAKGLIKKTNDYY